MAEYAKTQEAYFVDDPKVHGELKALAADLDSEAEKRVGERQPLERRWLSDAEQYHGRYDRETEQKLKDMGSSQLFINMTKRQTDAMSARLMDLLFPTDDQNWGIQPTPVPELTQGAKMAAQKANEQQQMLEQTQQQEQQQGGQAPPQMQREANFAKQEANNLRRQIEEAKIRAESMQAEIHDQLKASLYHAAMRDVIDDACKLGTGVCKGPVTGDQVRRGWKRMQQKDKEGNIRSGYGLQMNSGQVPAIRWVDVWSFFPDMNAKTVEDSEGIYERRLMNKKALRHFAKTPGVNIDGVRNLLRAGPEQNSPSYTHELRNVRADNQQVTNDIYQLWCYSGPLEQAQMKMLAEARQDELMLEKATEADPLAEMNAMLWFCQGELLKIDPYPYDSGECMYSVFNLLKDEYSIFGAGIPALIRDPQSSLNAGWRAMMDNAGLASGPQIVIDETKVEPIDGKKRLTARKMWRMKTPFTSGEPPFWTFDIPMHQQEMANIIALSRQFIDDMSAMPQIAQGEQGEGVTKTAHGMSMLMNSANVVFRRIVKEFDDSVTVPNIRRFYDWNMQYSTKEHIKGDFGVDARGSSVLLVREMQAQNLMFIATNLATHPKFEVMFRDRNLLKKLFQSMMIPADDVLLTDEEIEAILQNAQMTAEQEAMQAEAAFREQELMIKMEELAFKREELQAKVEIANMEQQTQKHLAGLRYQEHLEAEATRANIKLDDQQTRAATADKDREERERSLATEAALAMKTGNPAGGKV